MSVVVAVSPAKWSSTQRIFPNAPIPIANKPEFFRNILRCIIEIFKIKVRIMAEIGSSNLAASVLFI